MDINAIELLNMVNHGNDACASTFTEADFNIGEKRLTEYLSLAQLESLDNQTYDLAARVYTLKDFSMYAEHYYGKGGSEEMTAKLQSLLKNSKYHFDV